MKETEKRLKETWKRWMITAVESHSQIEDEISPAEISHRSPGLGGSSQSGQLYELCREKGRLEKKKMENKKGKNGLTFCLEARWEIRWIPAGDDISCCRHFLGCETFFGLSFDCCLKNSPFF